jgi:hypothetical protein
MAQAVLNLHSGGQLVSYDELQAVPTPQPQGRWHPVPHVRVLDSVLETLKGAGYEVRDQKHAVARNGHRYFATLDLGTPLVEGVSLAVGIRNSTDRSFPLSFCAGARVFVCSNLAFRSELLVRRKHTLNGMRAFGTAIGGAVASLASFKDAEEHRIKRMQKLELTPSQASHLILTAFRRGIISSVQIAKVCEAWENPPHDEFKPRTAWSLMNSFTEVLKGRTVTAPQAFVSQTIRLNGLMLPEAATVTAA